MCWLVCLLIPHEIPFALQDHPNDSLLSPTSEASHPIFWLTVFPPGIIACLVSNNNPQININNTGLGLSISILPHNLSTHCFDVQYHKTLILTHNSPIMWYQHKCSATLTLAPTHILCLQSLHQYYHQYVILHDFVSDIDNEIDENLPFLLELTNFQIIS